MNVTLDMLINKKEKKVQKMGEKRRENKYKYIFRRFELNGKVIIKKISYTWIQ